MKNIQTTKNVAAVILAGGKSRRMGRDKLEMDFGGMSLLESAVQRFAEEFENVYVSIADADKYPEITANKVIDIYPGAGPLSGLHAALTLIPCDGIFLVAADLPYASAQTAKHMIEMCAENEACILRLPDGRLEPLFGFYRKSLRQSCGEQIKSGDNRMSQIIYSADTRYVSPQELGDFWDEKMIMNINYPTDYTQLSNPK